MKLYVMFIFITSVFSRQLLACSEQFPRKYLDESLLQLPAAELTDLELLGRAVLARTEERDNLALQLKDTVRSIYYLEPYIWQLKYTVDYLQNHLEQQQKIAQEKNTRFLQQLALVTLERNALMDERDYTKKERDRALQRITELEDEKKNAHSQPGTLQIPLKRYNQRIAMQCHIWSKQQRQQATTIATPSTAISPAFSQKQSLSGRRPRRRITPDV